MKIKKSEEEILRLNQELSILYGISLTVNQSLDLDEILNKTLDKLVELTDVPSVGIYLLDKKSNDLLLVSRRGFSGPFSNLMKRMKMGEGITGRVALTRESIFIEDYPNHLDAIPRAVEEGVKCLAVVPLKAREKIYGTLNIARREYAGISPFERNLFNSIGQIIGGAMERVSLYSENVKRLEEQKTLYSISHEIASRLELDVILQKLIQSTTQLLEAEAGTIVLWNQRKQNYAITTVHGLPAKIIGKEVDFTSGCVAGEILRKKSPVLCEDYGQHPYRLMELEKYHFKEVFGVPLIVREMIIGAMVIGTSNPGKHFHQSEIGLLSNFAHHAAIAIGNARLYEDSLISISQLTALFEIGKALSSTLNLDELLKKALDLLRERLGYASCAILFLDREKDELYIKQVTGVNLKDVKDMRFRVGVDGIVGRVAETGEPIYVPDVSKDPRYISGPQPRRSEAAFPLKTRDRVIGVLNIESNEPSGFNEEDLRVLSSLASQMSISIENAELFANLNQTLGELKLAQDQIIQAEKLRAMGEMASGVAHDFNNALAVILGNVQLLLHDIGNFSQKEIFAQLKMIERSAKDASETVRRIQGFTGMRRDREFTPVSLNEIVSEVVSVAQPRWRDQSQKNGILIQLTTSLGDVPAVMGNPSELREVLTNLLFNAVDAMPRGGQITISTTSETKGWVEVKVTDTGIGMTEEVKRRMFDPFFTTKGVTNSGLGTSVSYGIIKRHGGEILVESEPGKGTAFLFRLPMGQQEEAPETKESKPLEDRRPAKILVIDDEDSVREVLSQMLKAKGYQVAVASTGEEGIRQFQSEKFDLVFTDLGMPKMSGWEVGKAIKEIRARTPVAMITGWGMEVSQGMMTENGIDLIIAKPFSFEQVAQLVSEAMDLKEKM